MRYKMEKCDSRCKFDFRAKINIVYHLIGKVVEVEKKRKLCSTHPKCIF